MGQAGVLMRVDNTTVVGGQGTREPLTYLDRSWEWNRGGGCPLQIKVKNWKCELDEHGQFMKFLYRKRDIS